MVPRINARPTATATIEAVGGRTMVPREHAIKVSIGLSSLDPKYEDREHVAGVARRALGGLAAGGGGIRDVAVTDVLGRAGRGGSATVVIGVEAVAVRPGRPELESVESVRAALTGEGYRVAVHEKRECAESGCSTVAILDWSRANEVPSGWYSNTTCGGHNYRTCTKCHSVFVLSSVSSVGQAPSVHCEVCGHVLIEWGSSKIWQAVLVARA